ncbi:DUF5305 family protein [Haloparvum sp. PAK95]|uniref:DUF5305 family protein n=1 Tax=Haloparvum sp. PAK95 TaxID=3418962 RepID=UPI003D2F1196
MIGTVDLKARYLLARHGLAVAAVLLVLAYVAGGAAGVAYANADSSYTVTEREHVQTFRQTANDSAVVTGDTPLWEEGTVLRDKPIYLTDVSPKLTVTSTTRTPANTEVHLSHRVDLVLEATVSGEELWSDRLPLTRRNVTVTDGRSVTETTIDVPATIDRVNEIRGDLSSSVSLSTQLRIQTQYESDRYAGSLSTTVPLSLGTESYSIGGFQPAERTHEQTTTRRRTAEDEPLPSTTFLGGGMALVSLFGAVVAVVGARRIDDPERIYRELERQRLDEWISAGAIPSWALEESIRMDTLTDLVDVAIDANERVIYDEARDVYAVVDGPTTYTYPGTETGFVFGGNDEELAATHSESVEDD